MCLRRCDGNKDCFCKAKQLKGKPCQKCQSSYILGNCADCVSATDSLIARYNKHYQESCYTADKNISIRCNDPRFTSMCTSSNTKNTNNTTNTNTGHNITPVSDTLLAQFNHMTNDFSTQLQSLQQVNLDEFPDIDVRPIKDQFAANANFSTIIVFVFVLSARLTMFLRG